MFLTDGLEIRTYGPQVLTNGTFVLSVFTRLAWRALVT